MTAIALCLPNPRRCKAFRSSDLYAGFLLEAALIEALTGTWAPGVTHEVGHTITAAVT